MRERRRRSGAALAVVFAATAVLLLEVIRDRYAETAGVAPVKARHSMADLSLTEMGGGTWKIEQHRGEVIAINLWATWCEPCRRETPGIVRVLRDLGPRGFAVVGVSLDGGQREGKVETFSRQFGVMYPIAFPDALSQMTAGIEGLPTTLLIDREGRVAKTYVGAVRESVLRRDVMLLLDEPKDAAVGRTS